MRWMTSICSSVVLTAVPLWAVSTGTQADQNCAPTLPARSRGMSVCSLVFDRSRRRSYDWNAGSYNTPEPIRLPSKGPFMRSFKSLSEQEVLALAISLEEEDARIYDDFADGLKETYPALAERCRALRAEEDEHRHRLLTKYREKFGDHIPHIRRQDVKGFVNRRPVWLVRPLGTDAVRKQAEAMELETKRFYEAAARRATDAGIRQLLGDLAEEERKHEYIT